MRRLDLAEIRCRPALSDRCPSRSMMKLKQVVFYVIVIALVSVVTLVAAEAALRLSGHVTSATVHTVSQADYDRIPGMFEPGQDVTETPHPRLHYHVTINGLGYRGREIEREKPPGVVRILCLGDSGTFGQFVNEDETASAYLEAMLRQEHLPVEVINGGVPGTTIVDQLLFLQRGIVLRPDIVILTFSENDITDLGAETPQHIALERNRQLKSTSGFRVIYEFVRDTALFNYVLTVRATWSARVGAAVPRPTSSPQVARGGEGYESWWRRYSEHLDTMVTYLAERNIRLLFNVFPSHHRIGSVTMTDRNMLAQLERIETFVRGKGISTIELLPSFLQSGLGKEDLYLLPYDGHANKVGYKLQATTLLPSVRTAVQAVLP